LTTKTDVAAQETQARVCEAAREEAESLLDAAQEAAATGELNGFAACEFSIYRALSVCPLATGSDPEMAAYVDGLLADLERLSEQAVIVAADQGEREIDGSVPPEPQPVPAERVAQEAERAREASYDLPVVVNAEVASLIDFYTGPYRERFIVALGRAGRYLPAIRDELERARMPLDLAYLPFVESAFNPKARSEPAPRGCGSLSPAPPGCTTCAAMGLWTNATTLPRHACCGRAPRRPPPDVR